MKPIHSINLFVICLLTTACHANQVADAATEQQATAEAPHPGTITHMYTPSQDIARAELAAPAITSPGVPATSLAHLQKGQPYVQFRNQALANGWTAQPTKMCMANVVGGNYESLCSSHPKLANCHLCQQMPELNTCSGDGYCTMQFRHPGTPQIMQVTTYGDATNWSQPDSSLTVTEWGFSSTPSK